MPSVGTIRGAVSVVNTAGAQVLNRPFNEDIADVVGEHGKSETVNLINGFLALSPPTGATFVFIQWVTGTGAWTLKGVTGDTGIALGTPSASTAPYLLTLNSASIGITSTATGTADVVWL